MDKTGAQFIIDYLVTSGVRRLYNFPGGTIAPILDAAQESTIDLITARHEQGAGYAALAESRIKGETQVVAVSSGPGVTNIVTVIADAYYDSTPLLLLTGQVGVADLKHNLPIRQRGFQEVDTTSLLRSITKDQFLVEDISDLEKIVRLAWILTVNQRPGPVLVDLPMNVQRQIYDFQENATVCNQKPDQKLNAKSIKEIVQCLMESKRPVILSGQGVLASRAQNYLRSIVTQLDIPVSHSMLGLGAIPTSWPMNFGYHGHTGNQAAGRIIQESDFLLVLGSRLDVRQTGTLIDQFAPLAKIVRIEIDETEIEYSRVNVDLTLKGNVREFLALFYHELKSKIIPNWSAWRDAVIKYKEHCAFTIDKNEPLKPQYVIKVLSELSLQYKTICVTGVGLHQQWVARHFDFDYPRRMLMTSGGHGAMGYDLPSAIGACIAEPDSTVLCIVGDGSFQINIQELATVVEYNLSLKIIILDNHRYGLVSQFQLLNWSSDPACGQKNNPDFSVIATGYGIPSIRIDSIQDIRNKLRDILTCNGPVLVHCIVDSDEDITPMLLAGQTLDKMWKK